MAATTALMLITSSAAFADDAATMPVEIVTQDTVSTGADGGILVPILTMIFFLLSVSGSNNYPA
ncbi:hypothetical protein [Nioella aestuarii]|uniref:hypothetical protein n=1 Tax=Nioella aestuarii TaxID=1662864 RepID=UPI003D7F344C